MGVPYRFETADQVVKFVAAAALCSIIAPSLVVAVLAVTRELASGALLQNWWTWWQGDTSGMLLAAPLVLSWSAPGTVAWSPRKVVEAAALAVLLIAASDFVLTGELG